MITFDVKRKIKKRLSLPFIVSDNQIQVAIDQAQVVSFDIFDTLVKRNVLRPEDIHYLVQDRFYRQTGVEINDYPEKRVNAERMARKSVDTEEITLEEIFTYITSVSDEQKFILKELEETIELENCCPNIKMKKVYEKAIHDNKHIIITSDMYLSKDTVERILHKCGYTGYEKLYLSSTYRLCKSTGNIFKIIKKDYADYQGAILHIGDDVRGDFVSPQSRKIKALLIDGHENRLKYWKLKKEKVKDEFLYEKIATFLNNHIDDNCNKTERIGYEVLGPMLLGYCKWLNDRLEKDHIEKVFFLSREGKLLQQAYNILYPYCKVPQCYLYVSRQSLTVPLVADARDWSELIIILKCYMHEPLLKTIRIVCGLEEKKFINELKSIGLNENSKIHEIPAQKEQQVFDIIMKLGNEEFVCQKKMVQDYLEEVDFRGRVAVADIGWFGTMQSALKKYISDDTEIFGYYLGARNIEKSRNVLGAYRQGYLFSPGINDRFDMMTRFTSEIIEIMFLNSDGSVQKYKRDNKVIPILSSSECAGKEGKLIDDIQNFGVRFLEQIKEELFIKETTIIPEDIIIRPYIACIVYPSLSIVKIFKDFKYLNGDFRGLFSTNNLFYYLRQPKKFKADVYKGKIFFLKNLFKVNIPYFDILRFMTLLGAESEYRKRYIN